MNFFSHYHYDRNRNDIWYNAGLLFPDLLRNFTKKQRISSWSKVLDSPNHQELSLGIKRHIKADEIFHNWSEFESMNHDLSIKIRDSNLDIDRDWFLAHIFVELAIDHILVNEFEEEVYQLYADLEACDEKGWRDFFAKGKLKDIDDWLRNLSRFIEHRYIFKYKNTESVVYALNRIYQKTGIGIFNSKQNDFLVVLLNDFIPELKPKLSKLENILK